MRHQIRILVKKVNKKFSTLPLLFSTALKGGINSQNSESFEQNTMHTLANSNTVVLGGGVRWGSPDFDTFERKRLI